MLILQELVKYTIVKLTTPTLLVRATNEIKAAFPTSQNVYVTSLLIATWDSVGYYSGRTDKVCMVIYLLAVHIAWL